MTAGAKSIWVVVSNETHKHEKVHPALTAVRDLLAPMKEHKRLEFGSVETEQRPTKAAIDGLRDGDRPLMAFVVYSVLQEFEELLNALQDVPSPIPVAIVAQKDTVVVATEQSLRIGYPHIRAIILEGNLRDPEDRGMVARLLKEEVRRRLSRDVSADEPSKEIGWKIERRGKSAYLSLFLDPVMREFFQRLLFVMGREKRALPPSHDESQVAELFFDLGGLLMEQKAGEKRKSGALDKLEQRAKEMLGGRVAPEGGPLGHILLQGETGVGKTLLAEAVASRLETSLLHVSTVNIGDNIVEAELFGTLAGAWTHATSRPGKLILGRGKTVFLDEIGDLPLRLQTKLLVYLDRQEVVPDGWPFSWLIIAEAHVVAATNRPLKEMVAKGEFREDLYYRFQHRLRVPSLRERRADLRVLIDFVLQDDGLNPRGPDGRREIERIAIAALERLERLEYRGNFRELQDVLTRAVYRAVTAGRDCIRESDIGP